MAFDFPNAPTTGQIYQPTGGPLWQYDGEKWKGGAIAGPQKEQFFDIAGKTVQDIAVPTWAKGAEIESCIFFAQTNYPIMRVSFDGSTFAAGVSDYANAGPNHMSGGAAAAYGTSAESAVSWFTLGAGGTNINIPSQVTTIINLTRPTTTHYFCVKNYSRSLSDAAGVRFQTAWWGGYLAVANAALAIKALRIGLGAAGTFGTNSWLKVTWLGDDAQIPTQNAIPDAPSDGGEYVRVNGVWRLKSQPFDVAGKGTQDIVVPVGARACELTGHLYCLTAGTYTGVQVSLDGSTFQGAANSYTYMGSYHNQVTPFYYSLGSTPGTSMPIVLPATGHSNGSVPVSFTANLNLVRTGSTLFGMRAYSREFVDAAGRYSQKTEMYSYVATGSGDAIKVIRFIAGAAWAGSSLINATWMY